MRTLPLHRGRKLPTSGHAPRLRKKGRHKQSSWLRTLRYISALHPTHPTEHWCGARAPELPSSLEPDL